jgi:endonuclease III
MKNSNEYATRLRRLISRLQQHFGAPPPYEPQDPVTELVRACLSETTTEHKARQALELLKRHFVDFNEMRVCRESELGEVLVEPLGAATEARAAAKKILSLLQQVFTRCDTFDVENLRSKNKRDAKELLGTLDGTTPYVAARAMLCGFKAHTFPMHEQMLAMLRHEEAVDPDASMEEVQGFLERQIPSSSILKTYMQFRRYSDVYLEKPLGEMKKKSAKIEKTAKGSKKNHKA